MEKLLLLCLFSQIEPLYSPEAKEGDDLYIIQYFTAHPLDLNTASGEDMLLIPFLSREIVERIIERREDHPFNKVSELLLIDGINPLMFERIRPMFTVTGIKTPPPRGYRYLLKGIIKFPYEGGYLGTPEKLYAKGKFRYKNNNIGFIAEKDYYEPDYLDYYSFSFSNKYAVVGDYDLSSGLGLLFGRPGYFYKGSGVNILGRGFLPHLSTFENNALFGIGIKNRVLEPFFSYKKLDCTFADSVYKPYDSGYHRKTSEIEKKDRVDEIIGGTVFFYKWFSGIISYAHYDSSFIQKNGVNFSLSFTKELFNSKFVGEISKANGFAVALYYKLSNGISFLYYRIPDNYYSYRMSPLEKGEGMYVYLERRILELKTYTYLNFEKVDSIYSYNVDGGITMDYKPLRWLLMEAVGKFQNDKISLRGDMILRREKKFVRYRLEMNKYQQELGYLAYVGVGTSGDLGFELRYVWFKSDSYNSRIYAYENDIPGEFTILPLYGEGDRFYMLIHYKPLGLYMKYSISRKEEQTTKIGVAFSK